MTRGESEETLDERKAYLRRYEVLKQKRTPWLSYWQELGENFAPFSTKYMTDNGKQRVSKNDLLNSTPLRSARVTAAGMMTSITSPARKWFKLSKQFAAMVENPDVRIWLEDVENGIYQIFARSNIYSALSSTFKGLAVFGTHAFFVEEDPDEVVRAYMMPLGTYCLEASARRSIDTCYRDCTLTTSQMVERFGYDKCSSHVQDLFDRGDRDSEHKVIHVVEPNKGFLEGKRSYKDKPFRSVWIEENTTAQGFLRESGYFEFPVLAPRWYVEGDDVYGSDCPGMMALGDAKQLQVLEESATMIVEQGSEPSLLASAALRNSDISLRPGDVTYGDSTNGAPAAAPLFTPPPHWISALQNKITENSNRISSAFFVDLFMALSETDRRQITAEEVRVRQQEKMLQLGPVCEQLNNELLDALIDRVFAIAYRMGRLPPAPKELESQTIRVEYLSILSQAQKSIGVGSIQQFVASVANLAQMNPESLDRVNFDETVNNLAEMYGVPPRMVNSMEVVKQIREARAQQQQMAQQMAMQSEAAQQVQTLAKAKTDTPSALTALMAQNGPLASAMGGGGEM